MRDESRREKMDLRLRFFAMSERCGGELYG
jgi:hypothetical protein